MKKINSELTYVFLIGVDSALLFLEDAEFFETFASLLSLIKFAFTLAILTVLIQHEQEVFT